MNQPLPSEDWQFVLLSHPEIEPIIIGDQPAPRRFSHFMLENTEEKDAIVFTLIGENKKAKIAYYVYGSWNFGDKSSFFYRDGRHHGPTQL